MPGKILKLNYRSIKPLLGLFLVYAMLTGCTGKSHGGDGNHAPVATDQAITAATATIYSGTLTGTDADNDPLTFSISANASNGNVTLIDTASGEFQYQSNTGFSGSDSFSFRVSDGKTHSPPATVTITVSDSNLAPLANDNGYTANEDTQLVVGATTGVLANDSDSDSPTLTAALETGPSHGTLNLAADGSFTYTPAAEYSGSDTFTYTAFDGISYSSVATVTLTVRAVNDAPTFTAGSNIVLNEGASAQSTTWATNLSTGASAESSQTLSFNVSNDNAALFTVAPGISVINGNGVLNFTPATDAFGVATVTVSLQDDGGTAYGGADTSASVQFSITINSVNDVPVFTKGTDQSVLEDAGAQTVAGWATGISAGAANESGQMLTFLLTGYDTTLFDVQPAVSDTGTLSYTPKANAFGSTTISIELQDDGGTANGGVDTTTTGQSFMITINSVPDAPVYSSSPVTGAYAGSAYGYDVNATDGDNDTLTYSLTTKPTGMTINSSSGLISWTPTTGNIGSHNVTVSVTDGMTPVTQSFTLVVGFIDDFSGGIGSWTPVDASGAVSNWTVLGNVLWQQNRVETRPGAFTESYHLGTQLVYDLGGNLSDFRFSVDLSFEAADEDDIGVVFHRVDGLNYYRFSMNSRYGYSRLEKRVAGNFFTLAVNSRGYTRGQTHNIAVEMQGANIYVVVDNDPVFAVSDGSLGSGTIALYSQDQSTFDNVDVSAPTTTPMVVLSQPNAHSVLTGNTIDAAALVENFPAGGHVEFLLDGSSFQLDSTAPFNATFSAVGSGDHMVEAILYDDLGVEVDRDTNLLVGTSGNYYVALGDSITNGETDFYATDNRTVAPKMYSAQGYEANLSALLDSSLGIPTIVYNEGIGGDQSSDTDVRVGSIINDRHVNAETALIMLGTNDAASGISTGAYTTNMQSVIDTVNASGMTAYVAKIPPSWGNSYNGTPFADPASAARNTTIQNYNNVTLTGKNNGPDFYNFFLGAGTNRFSLFADNYHPNGLGYVVMAHLWHDALTNPDIGPPFILENINLGDDPTKTYKYKQNLLETGDTYYVDETFTLTSIPAALANGRWIMPLNADMNNTTAGTFLTFDVDRNVDVYIAYDGSASSRPNWMSGFTATGSQIQTDNGSAPTMPLYHKSFTSGTVTLGGNKAAGSTGTIDAMYVVIVVEQ